MTPQLIGKLLSTTLGGYSGAAAGTLLEREPELGSRIGPGAFDLWRQNFEERLGELATALSFERPEIFSSGCRWARRAYEAREATVGPLSAGLEILQMELVERLPEGSEEILAPYFGGARVAVEGSDDEAQAADPEALPSDSRALRYLELILDGEVRAASQWLVEAHRQGVSVAELIEQVVVPAQRTVGSLWHRGEINVAEEHLATLTSQRAVTGLTHDVSPEPAKGKTAVIAAVTGDTHDQGLRLLAELFGLAGWRSLPLGGNVPRVDLLQVLDAFGAHLLVLSATLARHLLTIRATVEAVRACSASPSIKVLVGGRAFRDVPELWRDVGADGWAATLSEAVEVGERLVTLDPVS